MNMKKTLYCKVFTLCIALGFLSGCALMPGMSTVPNNQYAGVSTDTALTPTIVPITPDVIQQFAPALNPYQYSIGIGDQVSIVVWGHPEFSSPAGQSATQTVGGVGQSAQGGQGLAGANLSNLTMGTSNNNGGYFVNSEGNILFPMVGAIHVAGLTELQATNLLTQKLSRYVKNPQLMVQVVAFTSQKVYIMGEVNQTTAIIPINETPTTLAYALSAVGGINQSTADASQIYVIRGSMQKPTIYWLNAESPAAMLYADNFPLQDHDVVFVSPAAVVRWNRILNQILPSVQTYFFTKQIAN